MWCAPTVKPLLGIVAGAGMQVRWRLNLAHQCYGWLSGIQASSNLCVARAQTAKIADVGLSRVMQATLATLTDGHFMRGCGAM